MKKNIQADWPAFPTTIARVPGGKVDVDYYSGVTIRDYFAAAALAHCFADTDATNQQNANLAYRIADAMMKERVK